jgi:hypothetical protein
MRVILLMLFLAAVVQSYRNDCSWRGLDKVPQYGACLLRH